MSIKQMLPVVIASLVAMLAYEFLVKRMLLKDQFEEEYDYEMEEE